MRLRFALGSWGNRHFEHTLYPLRTPHAERLPRYAALFDAVELDVLHHQAAEEGKLEDWAAQVPDGFRFLPKMHKSVTHGEGDVPVMVPRALRARPWLVKDALDRARAASDTPPSAAEAGGTDDLEARRRRAVRFLQVLEPLRAADLLGPALLQFPPELDRLRGWDLLVRLLGLGEPGAFAVEFRHTSWFAPAVERVLEETETPLVWSTYPKAFAPPWRTGAYGYVRFTGKHAETRRRRVTVADRLDDMLEMRKRLQEASWREAFVVVTNGFEGNAVDSLPRVAAALGEDELARRCTRPPGGHLFPDS